MKYYCLEIELKHIVMKMQQKHKLKLYIRVVTFHLSYCFNQRVYLIIYL